MKVGEASVGSPQCERLVVHEYIYKSISLTNSSIFDIKCDMTSQLSQSVTVGLVPVSAALCNS